MTRLSKRKYILFCMYFSHQVKCIEKKKKYTLLVTHYFDEIEVIELYTNTQKKGRKKLFASLEFISLQSE